MLLSAACGPSAEHDEPISQSKAALRNAIGPLPPTEGKISWSGVDVSGLTFATNSGGATLIAPNWILTAAHVFANVSILGPEGTKAKGNIVFATPPGTNNGSSFQASDVFFAPDFTALSGKLKLSDYPLNQPPNETATPIGLDIALVHMSLPVDSIAPAKLWNPGGDTLVDIKGLPVTETGAQIGNGASGPNVVVGIVQRQASTVIDVDPHAPGAPLLEHSDSGSGLYLNQIPSASQPFPYKCALQPGGIAEAPLLIGTNQGVNVPENTDTNFATENYFVPIYGRNIAQWIGKTTAQDDDGDGLCNGPDDNCPTTPNPDQANCNQDAEDAWGGGMRLGDACDPAPCPNGSLQRSRFVRGGSTIPKFLPRPEQPVPNVIHGGFILPSFFPSHDAVEVQVPGRDVDDQVRIDGILASRFNEVPLTPIDSNVTTRFCSCIDPSTGVPIGDLQRCQGATFSCTLSTREADRPVEAPIPPPTGQTAWHRMSLGGRARGASFPIHYPAVDSVAQTWDYAMDSASWQAQQFFVPLPPSLTYGPGTDVGGVFWSHDPASAGYNIHVPGTAGCDPSVSDCSFADHYASGVGPNPRTTGIVATISIPLPVRTCSSCVACGDPIEAKFPFPFPQGTRLTVARHFPIPRCDFGGPFLVATINPSLRNVTYWGVDGGGVLGNEAFSQALRDSLVDANVRWVPHSEPVSMCNAVGCPKAYAFAADGSRVVDAWATTPIGYRLADADEGPFPIIAHLPINKPGATARTGFAAVWSRLVPALYIAGGTDPATGVPRRDVFRFHQGDSAWSSVPLSPGHVVLKADSAVFSHLDWRLWVLDNRSAVAQPQYWLLRIDPETGSVETDIRLPSLDAYTATWLSTLEDGRVVLSATNASSHAVAILVADAFTRPNARVVSARFDAGEITSGPTVGYGQIAFGTGKTENGFTMGSVQPVRLTVSDITQPWPALNSDLVLSNLDVTPPALLLCATGSLLVDDGVVLRANSSLPSTMANAGATQTNLGASAQAGNIWSTAPVVLRDDSRVGGFVQLGGSLTRQNGVTITGPIVNNAHMRLPDITHLQIAFPPNNSGNISLEPDQQRTISPGAYANITVKSRARLSLRTGIYFMTTLDLEPQGQLVLDKSAGPIFLYIKSGIIYRGALITSGGLPGELFVGYFGTSTAFLEAPFVGTFVAPNAKVDLASTSTGHMGAFCGRNLEAHPWTTITHLPFSSWPSFQ